MVRAFSSLCGSLFLLWQHYQTCKALWIFLFHMACTVYQVHRLILCLSPLGSILRISQSPLHSRLQHVACVSDYSHGYSLQVQVSFLSIHLSIHPSISNPSPDVLHPSNTFKQIGMPWKSPKEGVQYGPRCPNRFSWLLSNTEKQQFCSELPSDFRAPHLSLRLC